MLYYFVTEKVALRQQDRKRVAAGFCLQDVGGVAVSVPYVAQAVDHCLSRGSSLFVLASQTVTGCSSRVPLLL